MFRRISRARTCPVCKSAEVYRVKRTGIPVRVVSRILNLRPYWCSECDTFFLAPRPPKALRIEKDYELENSENKGTERPHLDGTSH